MGLMSSAGTVEHFEMDVAVCPSFHSQFEVHDDLKTTEMESKLKLGYSVSPLVPNLWHSSQVCLR